MTKATKHFSNRIAIVFDFDDTLVPDSFDSLLESCDINAHQFRQQRIQPLINQEWDKILARFYALIDESIKQNNQITQEYLCCFGKSLTPFEGVSQMFKTLREKARVINPKIEIEYYLITCGMAEVARHNPIASNFRAIWGCEFDYNKDGGIHFMKKLVTHTEKTRYLFQIAKGIDQVEDDEKMFLFRDIPQEEMHIPLSQMIYVGDGASDIPCFSVLNEEGGIAIGVYKDSSTPEEWSKQVNIFRNQRVANIASANYSENSELMQSLKLAVEGICKKISLYQLSVGE
ncbi:haloacid dehalogenase-like hydrolase [Plectonema cf. radiosum LEGE 06105]|uniref:Haloacid dehalogenase-like hydrolase n=1 Tax=Plectonema cf. radiosum LEGE 06105 TaxID=945769 RepID=A0A8J7JZS8_9CYAN|nr:haloacid dehalogenase-like hydrolase [Plectonema radiosum]MBE9212287.1 haloacid dehalogenase-like hydrolase [Plectonema cf. radiosum LEGE 06105]